MRKCKKNGYREFDYSSTLNLQGFMVKISKVSQQRQTILVYFVEVAVHESVT